MRTRPSSERLQEMLLHTPTRQSHQGTAATKPIKRWILLTAPHREQIAPKYPVWQHLFGNCPGTSHHASSFSQKLDILVETPWGMGCSEAAHCMYRGCSVKPVAKPCPISQQTQAHHKRSKSWVICACACRGDNRLHRSSHHPQHQLCEGKIRNTSNSSSRTFK